jgi:hypothetical protein
MAVVYEDDAARDQAIHLCETLLPNLDEDLKLGSSWWGFKFLKNPEIAAQAGEALVQADLIIISTHRAENLSLEVIAWVERWLMKRIASEGALVVLQGLHEQKVPLSWQDPYLRSLAQRANLDYLLLPEPDSKKPGAAAIPELPVLPTSSDPKQPRHKRLSGWGIND